MRTFLLASFPALRPEDPPPITFEELITECARHLPDSELEELDAVCSIPPRGKTNFAKEWADAWQGVQDVNTHERKQRLPSDTASPRAPVPPDELRAGLAAAWESGDPLRRETELLMAQWAWIESRRRAAPYSQDDLIGYALQLQLLERRDSWDETAGQTQFDIHTQSFLDPVLEQLQNQDLSA